MKEMEYFSFPRKQLTITYCVMKLSEYMRDNLVGRGTQAKFARKARISSGTVSKWAQGEMDRAPNFENCLRIAAYFRLSPLEVFEMADRPDYRDLFAELFPQYEPKFQPEQDLICCSSHKQQHEMLNDILHSGKEDLIYGITVNLQSLSSSATGRPYSSEPKDDPASDVAHGPYGFDRRPRKRQGN